MFWIVEPAIVPYFWLTLAILFLFAELGTPGLFIFIAFSVGFFISAVTAFFEASFVVQCWTALISSILAFTILKYFFASKIKNAVTEDTNTDALTGRKGVVVKIVEPNKKGQVKIGGEIWSAISQDNMILQTDEVIKVLRVVGNKLIVRKL